MGDASGLLLESSDYRAAASVLASFDPASFLLHINADDSPFTPEQRDGDWASTRDVFESMPTSLLAHEMSHVLHGATTAAGAREFMLSLDLLRLEHSLIEAAATCSQGPVAVPLLENVPRYAHDREFALRFLMHRRLMSLAALFHGGSVITEAGPMAVTQFPGLAVFSRVRVFGEESTYPVHVFLPAAVGLEDSRPIAVGYLHISEGIGKAVEEIQRGLTGEPGSSIRRGEKRDTSENRIHPWLFERYYLSRYVFVEALAARGIDEPSTEEFILLSELALMADPLVRLYEHPEPLLQSRLEREPGFPFDTNPFTTYLELLEVYCREYERLPHLGEGWGQEQANQLQDAVLNAAGIGLTISELTMRLRNYMMAGLSRLGPSEGFPLADLPSLYQDTFTRLVDWRIGQLAGGSPITYLFSSPESLVDLAERCVPAIVIGASILSSAGAFRPGEGVGVDIVQWQAFADIVQRLLIGDAPCRFHLEQPRACVVPEWSLCSGLRDSTVDKPGRCVQEQTMTAVMGLSGASSFMWTSDRNA